MTTRNTTRRRLLCPLLGLLALSTAGVTVAGNGPDPSGLPHCSAADYNAGGGACRLPLKNGNFSEHPGGTTDIASWQVDGAPSIGTEGANTYAQMFPGSAVKQFVFLDTVTRTEDATYVLRFKYRGDSSDTPVEAHLSMSNDDGSTRLALGSLRLEASAGEWRDAELIVGGKAFGAPAHVLVEIANVGSQLGASAQIDDVFLVESAEAEAAR